MVGNLVKLFLALTLSFIAISAVADLAKITCEYRCVRIDEFEEWPRHDNRRAGTATFPGAERGRKEPRPETLYFVETRRPND
jgi:hypothetical protein